MNRLDHETFQTIVENTPLFSIDLVVLNDQHEVLLGHRKNAPAQGYWFVPGGRVFKNESLQDAFRRICMEELNHELPMTECLSLGLYDHFYDDSIFGDEISTHYINAPYLLRIESGLNTLPLDQHKTYRWAHIDELDNDTKVHDYARIFLPTLRKMLDG